MQIKPIQLLFFILPSIIGCHNNNRIENREKQVPKYSIALKENDKNSVKNFTDLFSSYEIIPLKFNDSSIIASVDKVILYKSRFYVLDKKFSSIYSFDRNGNFLIKYGKVGLHPGEFRRINDFDIDSVNNQIAILSNDDLSIYYYSLDNGSFLKQTHTGLFGSSISVLSENNVLIYINYNTNGKSNNYNIILLDSNGSVIHKYFSFNTDKRKMVIPFSGFLQKSNDHVFFSPAYDDIVYVYNNNDFTKYIYININSAFIEKNKADHFKLFHKEVMLDSNTSFLGNVFLKNNNYIIVTYQNKASRKVAFYNISNQKISILSKAVQDPLIKLIQEPYYLGPDNTVVFSISTEAVLNLKEKYPKIFIKLECDQKKIIVNSKSNYFLLISLLKSN